MRSAHTILSLAIAATLIGCGQSETPTPTGNGGEPTAGADTQTPPVASIGGPGASVKTASTDSGGMTLDVTPETTSDKDSPEWVLEEIALLRAQPISDDPKLVGQQRRDRNAKIIDLATKLIAETHDDPAGEKHFNNAVRQLLETRLEMALAGQPDDIDALFADVKDLDQRDHDSVAAEEGAFTLVRFAHQNAQRFAATEPRWFQELSRQARLYADGYPKKGERAAPILFAAARSCEINSPKVQNPEMSKNLIAEAKLCYTALKEQFPGQPQGQRAVAILRRLALPGTKLDQFSGPTLDGKFARIEQLRGRTEATVIAFWSSENEEFAKKADLLASTVRKHRGVYLLGVNLDSEEIDVKAFLAQHDLPGKQIFFTESNQRRWDNPLVSYWGIVDIPTLWVLAKDGTVLSTNVSIDGLDRFLQGKLGR